MITKDNYHYLHRLSKRTVPFFQKKNRFTHVLQRTERNSEANDFIKAKILSGEPFMAARLGHSESEAIVNFKLQNENFSELTAVIKHLKGDINMFWKKDPKYLNNLITQSGFFPNDEEQLAKFESLMDFCTDDLDLLGIWTGLEAFFNIPEATVLSKIRELEPWFFEDPWTSALAGKKVLLVHPFDHTIHSQYARREEIYENEKLLPRFELITLRSVMTVSGENSEFKTWFDALRHMQDQIDVIDFDIAIIGCAAYGLPLASYVKNMGKAAIHLGGVTQLLFGIKGKRWEEWPHYKELRKHEGKFWVYAEEIPKNYKTIEGGCYW